MGFQGCWGYEAAGTFASLHDVACSVLVSMFLLAIGIGTMLAFVRVLRTVREWSWLRIGLAVFIALAIGLGGTAASGFVHSEARCPDLTDGDIHIDRAGFPAYFSIVLDPEGDPSPQHTWQRWALIPDFAFYSTLAIITFLCATSSRSRSALRRNVTRA